jgi:hypothetical protein
VSDRGSAAPVRGCSASRHVGHGRPWRDRTRRLVSRRGAAGCEVTDDPAAGKVGHRRQGVGLLEQVGGARHDGEAAVGGSEHRLRLPVQSEHDVVVPTDDEQRRSDDVLEVPLGQVGPSAPGHDRSPVMTSTSSSLTGGSATGRRGHRPPPASGGRGPRRRTSG